MKQIPEHSCGSGKGFLNKRKNRGGKGNGSIYSEFKGIQSWNYFRGLVQAGRYGRKSKNLYYREAGM